MFIAAAVMYTIGHATTFASPSNLVLSWQNLSLLPRKGQTSAYSSVSTKSNTLMESGY